MPRVSKSAISVSIRERAVCFVRDRDTGSVEFGRDGSELIVRVADLERDMRMPGGPRTGQWCVFADHDGEIVLLHAERDERRVYRRCARRSACPTAPRRTLRRVEDLELSQ